MQARPGWIWPQNQLIQTCWVGLDPKSTGWARPFWCIQCQRVNHTIQTDSVPTDAIPTVHAQSGRRVVDCSWIGLRAVLIGKTPNQIPKIGGSTILLEVGLCCNFTGRRGTPDPLGYPSQAPLPSVTSVFWSMPCFRCIQRLDPFRFLPNFYYFYICKAC